MDALKTASHNLLTQLQQAAVHPEDVYVSIVPFSKDVNFGSANYAQSWLRWDLWEEDNGSCSSTRYSNRTSCQSHSKVWTPAAHNTWNGCVTDRDQNFDTTNDAAAVRSKQYPTEQYSSCSASLVGLTKDGTALNAKIDTMAQLGNTNQAIGLQVGWQTLTATPFTVPPVDPDYKYQTVIILLTDGLNTQDRWYTSQSSINTRQQKTCDNIKAAGLTVTRYRSTPVAMRPRRCCRTAPATRANSSCSRRPGRSSQLSARLALRSPSCAWRCEGTAAA
jgi:hypothetical protein